MTPCAVHASAGSSHELVLAALRSGAAPGELEVIETHMSWVYLLGDQVLKLKKPVHHTFLDFTRLDAREAFCREEVRLNARLAPGIYLGLMALQNIEGQPSLVRESGLLRRADAVDWLVHMKRLPRARMLDEAMAHRAVLSGDVDALVRVLADFYRAAARIKVSPAQHVDRLQHELLLSRDVILDPRWVIPGAAQTIQQCQAGFAQHQAALGLRAVAGRIVEGHGDLRPEHVCLLHPPVVIDCIEFSAALRQVDPFDELAFLAMECRMAGAGWIGERLIEGCGRALGDQPPRTVLQLYTAHHALVRARLSLAHLFDPQPRTPERWVPQARRYLMQAQAALDALLLKEAVAPQQVIRSAR
ncbi:hypothetical protein ASE11_07630 [Hydrogenophaga sp. Root209]|uniref:hypothetical protein n=1 Tax=Hydrogenophaga sp. Root209 TaxID=1736490 RepID=UPI0006F8D157|nr:hypothetical protein [Hydrogenophaga sp. Root209]KRB99565.1 hypothetical protein ASE11_07630 [Hydrogenophaga sp. Root209]